MSHEALIQDLQQKSSGRIKQIRLDVEARAEELRNLKKEEFERLQAEVLGKLKDEGVKVASPILHEAERSALTIEDEAMGRLSERMYAMAVSMLGQLRQQDYKSVFAELAKEVESIGWERVRVNPRDKKLAEPFFPGAVIETDSSITGGFLASTDGGRYQVINTLEQRLKKGWPVMLTILLKEILKEHDAESAA